MSDDVQHIIKPSSYFTIDRKRFSTFTMNFAISESSLFSLFRSKIFYLVIVITWYSNNGAFYNKS